MVHEAGSGAQRSPVCAEPAVRKARSGAGVRGSRGEGNPGLERRKGAAEGNQGLEREKPGPGAKDGSRGGKPGPGAKETRAWSEGRDLRMEISEPEQVGATPRSRGGDRGFWEEEGPRLRAHGRAVSGVIAE
ncbi:hypothetical protein NDU88_001095 [Pleurodeles waltl]|uniref:Uncharacterized protein n=1 Tax=Pleurodeles waltl TaxID=8319 RepID=A0AAV7M764_PLEWA|nr:hypothetical protein NDU88_001095 [Pleurodeles waltl]